MTVNFSDFFGCFVTIAASRFHDRDYYLSALRFNGRNGNPKPKLFRRDAGQSGQTVCSPHLMDRVERKFRKPSPLHPRQTGRGVELTGRACQPNRGAREIFSRAPRMCNQWLVTLPFSAAAVRASGEPRE
jgi:hypothetical protein